jgi:hypothetical protein
MHTPSIRTHLSSRVRVVTRLAAAFAAAGLVPGAMADTAHAGAPHAGVPHAGAPAQLDPTLSRPHVLTNEITDVFVRVNGVGICTGTPITGTRFVVTAAHCVLDQNGTVVRSTKVTRDGVTYSPVSVLVNPEYRRSPGPRFDAAVVIMDQAIPGPSAALGDAFPKTGPVTLAGFQALDADGSLLRGTRYDNRPLPTGTTPGAAVEIRRAAAGCVHMVSEAQIIVTEVKLPCGLIPGASGGGLFVEQNGELILVGILSTVAPDLSYNGVVRLDNLLKLIANPTSYPHRIAA